MAYHNDLLSNAKDVLVFKPENQATLRHAVSTAYYSIFHLLIFESCQLWGSPEHRNNLSRQFDHNLMKTASRLIYDEKFKPPRSPSEISIVIVATNFVQLQRKRNECDYDLSFTMSSVEADRHVDLAQAAFDEWAKIRTNQIARDYLYALLFRENKRA